jgi:arylsulfatase A-like enzyme
MIPCLLIGGTCPCTEKQSGTQNVLMIAIDDLKTIGSLYSDEPGNFLKRVYPDDDRRTQIANRMTPNLTRLAAHGVTFTNAHCAAPACKPSRAALMTGIRPLYQQLILST